MSHIGVRAEQSGEHMRTKFLVLLFLLISGLFLRFSPALSSELWTDESLSFYYAKNSSYKALLFQSNQYADIHHPPYYYLLLKVWLNIFPDSEFSIRSLSIIFFPATMLIVFYTGKKYFSDWSGLFGSAFLSFHPLMVNLGFQARMYAHTLFFASVGTYFLLGLEKKNASNKEIVLASLFFSLSFYLDYTMLWIFPTLFFLTLYYFFRRRIYLFSRYWKLLIFTTIFSFFQLSHLVIDYVSVENIGPGSLPHEQFGVGWVLLQLAKILGVLAFDSRLMSSVILLSIVCFSFFSLLFFKRSVYLNSLLRLFFFYLLSPLLVSFFIQPMFLARNVSYAVVLLSLVMGELMVSFLKDKKMRLIKISIVFMIFFGLFINSFKMVGFEIEGGLRSFAKGIAESNSVLYLLPGMNKDAFIGYYFYKNSLSEDRIVQISQDNFFAVIGNKTNKKHFLYSSNCDNEVICLDMKIKITDICEDKVNCKHSQR